MVVLGNLGELFLIGVLDILHTDQQELLDPFVVVCHQGNVKILDDILLLVYFEAVVGA
jgi:hypothetical protein